MILYLLGDNNTICRVELTIAEKNVEYYKDLLLAYLKELVLIDIDSDRKIVFCKQEDKECIDIESAQYVNSAVLKKVTHEYTEQDVDGLYCLIERTTISAYTYLRLQTILVLIRLLTLANSLPQDPILISLAEEIHNYNHISFLQLKDLFFDENATIKPESALDYNTLISLLNNLEWSVSYEEASTYFNLAFTGIDEMERSTAEWVLNESRNNSEIVLECFSKLNIGKANHKLLWLIISANAEKQMTFIFIKKSY